MYEDSSRDMKCQLIPGIKSISGVCGDKLYKTYTKPDGSKETRVYLLQKKANGKYGYERKAALTEREIKARVRFQKVTAALASLSEQSREKFYREWKAAKYKFNGKEYATLRGYIMARLYVEMDANKG